MNNPLKPRFEDEMLTDLLGVYFEGNAAARCYRKVCDAKKWHFEIDHVALRCLNIAERARPFVERGYTNDGEQVEYPKQGWWAKIYRKTNHPVVFVDQAYEDEKGKQSIIPAWVAQFGDNHFHHAAVLVDDIDEVVAALQAAGVLFSGSVIGTQGSRLRQIFSVSEMKGESAYTVLELTERNGYTGFYADQANQLMESSKKQD